MKGSKTLKELKSVGMKLVKEPKVPSQYELASIAGRMLPRRVHPTWKPFLGLDARPLARKDATSSSRDDRVEEEAILDQ